MPVAATMQAMDAGLIARAQVDAIHATAASINPQREAADLERRTDHLAAILRSSGASLCINHGDLQTANLIGGLPVLIDWEYAQVAAPTYDIACLLTYYPRLQGWQSELLAACGLARPEDLELLGLQRRLFACLNRLWAMAHGLDKGLGSG
jgi:aminoglycoside phosphotransferase (APT) family kinase protein